MRYDPSPTLAEWAAEGGPNDVDTAPDGGAEFETIRLEYPEEGVAHVIPDRPGNLNPVNGTVLEELGEVMDRVEADEDARSLLGTSAGDTAFCGRAVVFK